MQISVALCTYNGEKYIAEQLDSILQQELPVDTIVICDDGSKDNTLNILNKYKEKYPKKISFHVNEKSLGVTKNFEKAINLCPNGIVLLSDQDDVWLENKTKIIKDYFVTHAEKKAVFHNLVLFEDNVLLKFTIWDYLSFDDKTQAKNNEDLLLYTCVIDNVLTGAASAIIKEYDINFNTDIPFLLHDFQILISYAIKNQLGIINQSLGYYRIHAEQQVGAQTAPSEYIIKQKNNYYSKDLKKKLSHITNVIIRNKAYTKEFPTLLHINRLLFKELYNTKKMILRDIPIFTRKRMLLSWYRRKLFLTSFTDVLFL